MTTCICSECGRINELENHWQTGEQMEIYQEGFACECGADYWDQDDAYKCQKCGDFFKPTERDNYNNDMCSKCCDDLFKRYEDFKDSLTVYERELLAEFPL